MQRYGVATMMLLGPTESLVIADDTADPALLAADLLIEAEHGTDSSTVLVTPSAELATATDAELDRQIAELPGARAEAARASLGPNDGCVLVPDSRRRPTSPTSMRPNISRSPSPMTRSTPSSTASSTPARS